MEANREMRKKTLNEESKVKRKCLSPKHLGQVESSQSKTKPHGKISREDGFHDG